MAEGTGNTTAEASPPPVDRWERRLLIASTALIAVVVTLQAPGRIVPETKLDLVLDPTAYLGRALSAWDPAAAWGRMQNQAAGYLFPMGPFYSVAKAIGVPAWLVQRAWITLVIAVALWGAHRLARAVGIASPAGRLVAAWAYALAPATLGVVAFQSAGQLPYSLAPWVLVPLVGARDGADPRRVAADSGMAILAMGGVNGTSAVAVLVPALVWFATRAPGRDRRRLAGWWIAAGVAATLWWLVPLLVSVRYGVRFTDFTETASQTTGTESAIEVWRGTGNWLGYLYGPGGYWLPGARRLTVAPLALAGSVAVAAAGAAGLTRRDLPGRSWLLPSALAGFALMAVGYGGPFAGSFAAPVQDMLDGPLAPFRNVHKFSAVLRLPLALGLGHLVAVTTARTAERAVSGSEPGRRPDLPRRKVAAARRLPAALAVAAIVAAIAPQAAGGLTAPGSFDGVPAAWRGATDWLRENQRNGRALLLPSATFGEYTWGRPLDEPIGAVDGIDWAVRDLIPLGGIGSTRFLDGLDEALARDGLPPELAETLSRFGIGHVVVRNDLDPDRTDRPDPWAVRRLLSAVDGMELVASFGEAPRTGIRDRLGPRPGETEALGAVDIWAVDGPEDRRVSTSALADVVVLGGGPEALVDVPAEMVEGRATVLAADAAGLPVEPAMRIGTDSGRRRDVVYGSVRDNVSATLTAGQTSPITGEDPQGIWPGGVPVGTTDAVVLGASTLTDSAPRFAVPPPEHQPASAFDGNEATSWVPVGDPVGDWIEAGFDEARSVGEVRVRVSRASGRRVGSVTVTTDAGSATAAVDATGVASVAPVRGDTTRLRITVESVIDGAEVGPVGLAEIEVEGVDVARPLLAAPVSTVDGADAADALVLRRSSRDRTDTGRTDEEGRLDRLAELARGTYLLSGEASLAPSERSLGAVTEQRRLASPLAASERLVAEASSTWRWLPAHAADAAVDGDPATAWISEVEPTAPSLRIAWDGPTTIDGIQIDLLDGGPAGGQAATATAGRRVVVAAGGERFDGVLDGSGRVDFSATGVDEVVLSFPDPDSAVAVAEVTIGGVGDRRAASFDVSADVSFEGLGPPRLWVDGEILEPTVTGTVGDLIAGRPLDWTVEAPLELGPGRHRFDGAPSDIAIDSVVVSSAEPPPTSGDARAATVGRWGTEDREVGLSGGDATILTVAENANDGWVAITSDGVELESITVDGWRQGWIVPAGDPTTVALTYRPAGPHRWGLLVGAAAGLALVCAAVWPSGRRRGGSDGSRAPWVAPGHRDVPPAVTWAAVVAVGVAVGGAMVVLVVPAALWPRLRRHLTAVAAASVIAAGAITAVLTPAEFGTHRGALSAGPQVPAVAALLAVAASAIPTGPDGSNGPIRPEAGSTRSNRRRSGRRSPRSDTMPAGNG